MTWDEITDSAGGLHELVGDLVVGFELAIDLAIEALAEQLVRSRGEEHENHRECARVPHGQAQAQARTPQEPCGHGSPS